MAGQGKYPREELPLVSILAEMLSSALEWESSSQTDVDSDASSILETTGIDCPPTDPEHATVV